MESSLRGVSGSPCNSLFIGEGPATSRKGLLTGSAGQLSRAWVHDHDKFKNNSLSYSRILYGRKVSQDKDVTDHSCISQILRICGSCQLCATSDISVSFKVATDEPVF